MADVVINPGNVVPSATAAAAAKRGIALVAIDAGQTVYKDGATGKFGLADANGANEISDCKGMAVCSAAGAGQPFFYASEDDALVLGSGTLVPGKVYVQSATAGAIAPASDLASGMKTTTLGVAIDANTLKLSVQSTGITVP